MVADKWVEEKDSADLEHDVLFKVDEFGFFIFWKSEGREGDVKELSQVNDIRLGELPKDPRLLATLTKRHGENFHARSLIVCSGLDMVNISCTHIICKDLTTAEVWREGLRLLTNNNKINNVSPMQNLKKHWMRLRFMVSVNGLVPVRHLTKTFASGKTEKMVYQALADVGLPNGKTDLVELEQFTFDKFYKIYQTICPRNDIDELFRSITGGQRDMIDCAKLVDFLNEKQRDPRLNEILYPHYNDARVMEIVSKYEPDPELVAKRAIGKEGFTRYLMSDDNSPVFLDRLGIYQDMDQPLSHYYVNSSHNTYLSGRQFGGKSSVEMYRQVLLAGCRCVELDCWDGRGEDQEPIITHGKAMCTDIIFKDVIYAIRDCAFVTSEYPVILSFENHCSRPQQYKMAKYCDEIFGELLLKEPITDFPLDPGQALPPPSRLKNKILIKNKRLKPEVEKVELDQFWKGEFSIDETEEPKEDAEGGQALLKKEDPVAGTVVEIQPTAVTSTPYQGSTLNIHPYLSAMVNYTCPMKFQGFDYAEEQNMAFKMSSFAETMALGYLKSQAVEFLKYNKRQLSRIYPKGTRADSSNFMPQIFWNSGCQLVSLNFQTPDLPMQLNQGKFEYNGNCGYLLKPDFMRREDKQFDPFSETPVDGVIAAQCSVQVISGQFLSDKKVGTYVEVDMYGLPTDTIRKEFRTKVIPSNGLNPVYNEDPFMFRKVVLPELAVLRFGVYDDNGKLLGQRILPFDDLQAGYRHIALRTEGNFPMSLPMLFCNIDLKIYIPDGLGGFMDALSDPRAFLSAQDKRAQQLAALGIQESDIGTDIIEGLPKKLPSAHQQKAKVEKPPDVTFDTITPDSLRSEKNLQKVIKKHQKELETLRKRHQKEKMAIQKSQCIAIDKICKSRKGPELVADAGMKCVVMEQMEQWTELVERHRREDWEMNKGHLEAQDDLLKSSMLQTQANQLKELDGIFERDNKEMKSNQAKTSVETARDVQADKSLKTKAEKERIIREKNANNTKRFIDERKSQAIKQSHRREKLKKEHGKQMESLQKYLDNRVEMAKSEERESQLAQRTECFV